MTASSERRAHIEKRKALRTARQLVDEGVKTISLVMRLPANC
jgi:hypothetical protein